MGTRNIYSLDGNPLSQSQPLPGRSLPDRPSPLQQEGLVLAPGNRASVLVKAGAPGTYLLRTLNFLIGDFGGRYGCRSLGRYCCRRWSSSISPGR